MFNSGYEMRSVTVTSLHNISSNLFFRTFLHFGSTKKVFPMKHVFEIYKNFAFEYLGNACVCFE